MESEGPKHIPRDNVFCETDCPRCAYDHKEFMKSEEARMESEGPYRTGDAVNVVFQDGREVESFDSARDAMNAASLANAAYAEGRKAERERCAKIAESHVTKFNGFQIADAIRGGQDGE